MAHELTLSVKKRTTTGTGVARRMRRAGTIPAILYSKGKEPCMLEVSRLDWDTAFRKGTSHDGLLVHLDVADGAAKASFSSIIKEIQIDRLTGFCLHVDFNEIDLNKPIRTEVHIETVGDADGVVNQGGILEHVRRTVEIECLPREMPDCLQIDVSKLQLNHSLFVRDLVVDAKIKVLTDPEAPIIYIAPPKDEVAETATAEGEAAPTEPELVRKERKEKDEDGEEAAAAPAADKGKDKGKEKGKEKGGKDK